MLSFVICDSKEMCHPDRFARRDLLIDPDVFLKVGVTDTIITPANGC
jgi:hypothetical protein